MGRPSRRIGARRLAAGVLFAVLNGLVVIAADGAAQAPEVPDVPTGIVQGVVFDSTRGGPLRDADVYLWNTNHGAVTGADGRFEIGDVPTGHYTLIFFHPHLTALGISPGGVEIDVPASGAVETQLAVPSMRTVLTARCLLEGASTTGQLLGGVATFGQVTDATTGAPLPGSRVTFSWPRRGDVPAGAFEVLTGPGGWFNACDVPAGMGVGVVARSDGLSSRWREFEFETERLRALQLRVTPLRPATLSGSVLDVTADTAVAGAEVSLRGTTFAAVSDRDGSFRLADVPPGDHTLVVRHPPYEALEMSLELGSGTAASVEVQLVEGVMSLEPLEVTVERTTQTERAMGGLVVARPTIEALSTRVRDLADVLREQRVSGLFVRRGRGGPCIGFTTGQVRMTPNRSCVALTVFIDGVRMPDPSAAFSMSPESIDHMILYRPIEAGNLFGAWSANGVLEIFTRR